MVSEEVFAERSRQSWIDVTLQIYKCFVLSRINARAMRENGAYAITRVEESEEQEEPEDDVVGKESSSSDKTR